MQQDLTDSRAMAAEMCGTGSASTASRGSYWRQETVARLGQTVIVSCGLSS